MEEKSKSGYEGRKPKGRHSGRTFVYTCTPREQQRLRKEIEEFQKNSLEEIRKCEEKPSERKKVIEKFRDLFFANNDLEEAAPVPSVQRGRAGENRRKRFKEGKATGDEMEAGAHANGPPAFEVVSTRLIQGQVSEKNTNEDSADAEKGRKLDRAKEESSLKVVMIGKSSRLEECAEKNRSEIISYESLRTTINSGRKTSPIPLDARLWNPPSVSLDRDDSSAIEDFKKTKRSKSPERTIFTDDIGNAESVILSYREKLQKEQEELKLLIQTHEKKYKGNINQAHSVNLESREWNDQSFVSGVQKEPVYMKELIPDEDLALNSSSMEPKERPAYMKKVYVPNFEENASTLRNKLEKYKKKTDDCIDAGEEKGNQEAKKVEEDDSVKAQSKYSEDGVMINEEPNDDKAAEDKGPKQSIHSDDSMKEKKDKDSKAKENFTGDQAKDEEVRSSTESADDVEVAVQKKTKSAIEEDGDESGRNEFGFEEEKKETLYDNLSKGDAVSEDLGSFLRGGDDFEYDGLSDLSDVSLASLLKVKGETMNLASRPAQDKYAYESEIDPFPKAGFEDFYSARPLQESPGLNLDFRMSVKGKSKIHRFCEVEEPPTIPFRFHESYLPEWRNPLKSDLDIELERKEEMMKRQNFLFDQLRKTVVGIADELGDSELNEELGITGMKMDINLIDGLKTTIAPPRIAASPSNVKKVLYPDRDYADDEEDYSDQEDSSEEKEAEADEDSESEEGAIIRRSSINRKCGSFNDLTQDSGPTEYELNIRMDTEQLEDEMSNMTQNSSFPKTKKFSIQTTPGHNSEKSELFMYNRLINTKNNPRKSIIIEESEEVMNGLKRSTSSPFLNLLEKSEIFPEVSPEALEERVAELTEQRLKEIEEAKIQALHERRSERKGRILSVTGGSPAARKFSKHSPRNRRESALATPKKLDEGALGTANSPISPMTDSETSSPFAKNRLSLTGGETAGEEAMSPVTEQDRLSRTKDRVDTVWNPMKPIIHIEEKDAYISELNRLSQAIERKDPGHLFHLVRRSAIFRLLGRLQEAFADVQSALEAEPSFTNAYFHRHILYSLNLEELKALDDLDVVLKLQPSHRTAYRFKADIQRRKGLIRLAISSYSNAVKNDPTDSGSYYQRGLLYENEGEISLALWDYEQVMKLNPLNLEATMRHAMYSFSNGHWMDALDDLGNVLKNDPTNVEAYLYRGKAYAKIEDFKRAVEDMTYAIHLNPNCSKAFFYRGGFLRLLDKKKSVRDLSVSLLLDDSEENARAYLHRGVVYSQLRRFDLALRDFKDVVRLDKNNYTALVLIGLVHLEQSHAYDKAIQSFTDCLKLNPVSLKALKCRAYAYSKLGDSEKCLKDYDRILHMKPDDHMFHLLRGRMLLSCHHTDLAMLDFLKALQINSSSIEESVAQKAIINSFLSQPEDAIEEFSTLVSRAPTAELYLMLGKTRFRAGYYQEAVKDFFQSLKLSRSTTDATRIPEIYYYHGLCYERMRNYDSAIPKFSEAISLRDNFALAYFHRGLCRLRTGNLKGVQDLTRAIYIDPSSFEFYLTRASYYELKKDYEAGIRDCNNAIQLQPNSIRAYLGRGVMKWRLGEPLKAIQDFEQALKLEPKCEMAFYNRAVCFHSMSMDKRALRDYSVVLMLTEKPNTNLVSIYHNRSILYCKQNDFTNALCDAQIVLDIHPESPSVNAVMGKCFHKTNQLLKAVQSYTTALKFKPGMVEAFIGRGLTYMDFGHSEGFEASRRDFARAIHTQPNYVEGYISLANSLHAEGKFRQAWHQFCTAIAVDGKCQRAYEGRAIINLQMKSYFAAYLDMTKALEIGMRSDLLCNRAVIHQCMNDKISAMRDYKLSMKLDPTYHLAYFNAGNIYFREKEWHHACEYYTRSLKYNRLDEASLLNRAVCKACIEDYEGAMKDIERVIRLNPKAAYAYFNRGSLLCKLGELEAAEEDANHAIFMEGKEASSHQLRGDVLSKMGKREDAMRSFTMSAALKLHSQSSHGKS
eukprot:Nk52_evm2s2514 gene=Nk52_evmTU2s2514